MLECLPDVSSLSFLGGPAVRTLPPKCRMRPGGASLLAGAGMLPVTWLPPANSRPILMGCRTAGPSPAHRAVLVLIRA